LFLPFSLSLSLSLSLALSKHFQVKDLKNRCQKVIELELQLDKERDVSMMLKKRGAAASSGKNSISSAQYQNQQKQMRALQKRLEQLVMVHRQLLRKYAQLELEKSEARKLMKLRDDRISQLDATCRAMSENMMSQSVRHENEMSKLRDSETDALERLNQLLREKDGEDAELASSPVHVTSPSSPNEYHHKKVHGNVSIRGGGSSSTRGETKVMSTPSPSHKEKKSTSGSRFFGRLRFF
jgi:hypothetical protein